MRERPTFHEVEAGSVIEVRAARAIEAGEEVLIAYEQGQAEVFQNIFSDAFRSISLGISFDRTQSQTQLGSREATAASPVQPPTHAGGGPGPGPGPDR